MKLPKKISIILLGIFLILFGLIMFGLSIPWLDYITGAVALVGGIFFFIDK